VTIDRKLYRRGGGDGRRLGREYLDLILAVKVVDSVDEAIAFIARHGSHLADAIVTGDATWLPL